MNPYVQLLVLFTYFGALYFAIFKLVVLISNADDVRRPARIKKPKLAAFPSVSVVIPAYNEEKGIAATIKSVLDLDYPGEKIRIIVVNDGSSDGTKKVIESVIAKNPGRKIVLMNQKNQGKARSLNNALKRINSDLFACLDADSEVGKDTLAKMVEIYQENDEKLAIVTPAMKVKKPVRFLQKLQRVEYLAAILVNKTMNYLNCIYVAPGPFSLYRTSIIKKLGGFDEHNLTEDQEIAYRVQFHHYKIRQCFNGYTYTNTPKTTIALYRQRNRWLKGSFTNLFKYRKIFLNKKYGDFGVMQMPNNIFNMFLGFAAVFLFFHYIAIPIARQIRELYIIGFDIVPFIKSLGNWSFHIVNINLNLMFLFAFLFAITFLIFYISHKTTDESMMQYGVVYLIPYFLVYYLILSFVTVIVAIELLLGKRQKW